MERPLLELKDIRKTYPGVQALKNVDFDLSDFPHFTDVISRQGHGQFL